MLAVVLALTLGQASFEWGSGPTVTGVGCAPPAGEWTVKLVRTLDGFKAPCIVAGGKALPATATAADIRQALAEPPRSEPPPRPTYADAYDASFASGKPLVVYVGCQVTAAGDWLTVQVDALLGYRAPCVVVSRPDGRGLLHVATLGEGAGADEIRRALGRSGVQRSASPFADRPTADVDRAAAGQRSKSPWTWTEADVPDYMEQYEPAKYTQRIAVTNGRDTITPVHRSALEEKWRVPGGLVGVRGWTSKLYRWAPFERWVGNIGVRNSFGYIQSNRGWKASYDVGAEFLDVLTNTDTGGVFEVRKAVKGPDGWQRFVSYRAPEHRPAGYAGPRGLDCRGCHSEAGTGSYSAGLVPGGDTVLSMPFPGLERHLNSGAD